MSQPETNINNINYNNNTNNKFNYNTFTDCVRDTIGEEASPAGLSGTEAIASQEQGILKDSGRPFEKNSCSPPREWRGVKIDLFANGQNRTGTASLKLKISAIKSDGTTQSLVGNLNSPRHYIWRQVPEEARASSHWRSVAYTMQCFDQNGIDYRASKLCLPKKSNSTELVALLAESDKEWAVSLIIDGARYDYFISKDCALTPAQRQANVIATAFIGRSTQLLTSKDLGL